MTNLELDIENASKLIKSSRSDTYKAMTEYSMLYQNTTENIKGYMPYLETTPKKALLPTSSGDHELEALLKGFTDLTCYDINKLAKYFVKLKLTAILSFTKKEFIHFMYNNPLDEYYFYNFKRNLDEDTRYFWEELYSQFPYKKIATNMFRILGIKKNDKIIKGVDFSKYCAENFTSCLEAGNYKLIKERLEKAKITYIDGDILELATNLNENFDEINLTNIYEFVNKNVQISKSKKFVATVKELINHLNPEGKMLISYLYRCDKKDVKKYQDKGLFYTTLLCLLESQPLMFASLNDKKTIMDKLYTIRNVQFLNFLKEYALEEIELPPVGIGYWKGDKDMAIIYTKK